MFKGTWGSRIPKINFERVCGCDGWAVRGGCKEHTKIV